MPMARSSVVGGDGQAPDLETARRSAPTSPCARFRRSRTHRRQGHQRRTAAMRTWPVLPLNAPAVVPIVPRALAGRQNPLELLRRPCAGRSACCCAEAGAISRGRIIMRIRTRTLVVVLAAVAALLLAAGCGGRTATLDRPWGTKRRTPGLLSEPAQFNITAQRSHPSRRACLEHQRSQQLRRTLHFGPGRRFSRGEVVMTLMAVPSPRCAPSRPITRRFAAGALLQTGGHHSHTV